MKKVMFLMAVAMMLVVVGCHRNVQNAQSEPVNQVETFDSAEALFNAISEGVGTHQDPQQSIKMVDQLVTDYPEYENNPVALFMLASFVYDEQLHDLDKARETYQRIVDEYPDCPFANDAAIAITQLGMTPEELVKMFEEQNQE